MKKLLYGMFAALPALAAPAVPLLTAVAPVAVAAIYAPAAAAVSQQVAAETRTLQVVYANGAKEMFVIRYYAVLNVDKREDGGPAIPLQGRFVDDRRCHWSMDSAVQRQIELVSQSGASYVEKDIAMPYVANFANEGSAFKLTQLRPENCGDARARFESDLGNARRHLATLTPALVNKDLPGVIDKLRRNPKVKAVTTIQ